MGGGGVGGGPMGAFFGGAAAKSAMNNRYSPNHVFAIGSVGEYQFSPSFAAGRIFLDEMLYPFVCACQTTCPLAIQPGLLIELLIDGKANTRDIFFPNAGGVTASA